MATRNRRRGFTGLQRIVAADWLRGRSRHEASLTIPLPDVPDDDLRPAAIGSADVDSRPSPEQQLAQKDMRDCIRREVGKLPDTLRTAVIFFTVRSSGASSHRWGPPWRGTSHSALQILSERFARGEIHKDEYEEKKAAILSGS